MNSQFLIGVAIVLLFGAGLAAYWGVQQSPSVVVDAAPQAATLVEPQHQEEAPPPVSSPLQTTDATLTQRLQDEARVAVVVLARDVPAHAVIRAEDLAVEQLRIAPPDSFADPNGLVGRVVWRDLPAGTLITESSFASGGPLARMIRPNERALAIAIDEVMGGGGHLQPGDFVDVLLFLPQDDKNADRTAQLLVPALRVLGVGDALGMTLAGEAAMPPVEGEADARRARNDAARTAVLAVPDALLTRFALATQVGRLSLAVRSAEEELLQHYYAGDTHKVAKLNQQLFQFEKLALAQAPRPQAGLVAPPPPGIVVHRGTAVSQDHP